jgi:hypothetical protein
MSTFADYAASDYDIRMTQGDTFIEQLLFEDGEGDAIDLFGYTFRSQLRRTADNGLEAEFDILMIDDTTVKRTLSASVTANLTGTYVHDLQWTDPEGRIRTLFAGDFEIEPEVTR